MTKKSEGRASRFEKNNSGCMWGLISMFDFRHVHSGQKFLTNRKHGSRRLMGALRKLDPREYLSEFNGDSNRDIGSEATIDDDSKVSYIKELMEEEMIGGQNQKKHASKAKEEPKQSVSTSGVYVKKSHRRMNKKSFDLGDDDELVSETFTYRKHRTSRSLDLNLVMEELLWQLPQKSGNHSQPILDSSTAEHQLGEATKVFVDYFSSTSTSKVLLDVLHDQYSDKEMLLKLLQKPDFHLLLHLQKLQDPHTRKDRDTQPLLERFLENGKQESFFWRKFKGLERSLSKRNSSSQDINSIVMQHPRPPPSYFETPSKSDDGQLEKGSSSFSFREFKRRLKLAVSKELRDGSDVVKASIVENNGLPSPRKEEVPEPLSTGDSMRKPMETEIQDEHRASYTAKQRVCSIHVEAKKHLTEVVGCSDVDLDFMNSHAQKSLGRILSFPDDSSLICSPRQGRVQDFASILRRSSPRDESEGANGNACITTAGFQESADKCTEDPGLMKECTEDQGSANQCADSHDSQNHETTGESCITEEELQDESPAELNRDNGSSCSVSVVESAGVMQVVRSSDAEFERTNNSVCSMSPSFPSIVPGAAEVIDVLHNSEEKGRPTSLELDALEVSSSSVSRSGSSPTKEGNCVYGSTDRMNQASPVSVLHHIYEEDDASSPCAKSLTVTELIQPRQIHFDEQVLPPLPHRFTYITLPGEYEKSTFEFGKVVVDKSGLTWSELLQQPLFLSRFLNPSLFEEVELLQDGLCDSPRLIFDLVEESLMEIRWHHPYSLVLKRNDIFAETWERVVQHLELERPLWTIEHIVARDYVKNQQWTNFKPDTESIGIEIEETILEELIEAIILDFMI